MLLREVIDKGASRRWKLISATKEPGADVILVTWGDTRSTRVDSVGSFRERQTGARIAEELSYRVTKDRKVLIYWQGRRVVVLKGTRAQKLLAELPGMDPAQEQLALAKATGNFKWGNERLIN